MSVDPYFLYHTNIISKEITDVNLKPEILKLLEDK